MHWRKDITKLLWPEKKYKFSKLFFAYKSQNLEKAG